MRIGPYEIVGELGRGGMAAVFRARDTDGREVALKLLAQAGSPSSRARFERERRLLASFGADDGFVPVLDMGEERGQAWLAMPLMSGGSLRDRLRRGALPLGDALALADSVAAALARAHERGVVHRDLKPENILFDGTGRPLVADLGLAKHYSSDSPGASQSVALSKTGQLLGTVGYMAPEQAVDARSVGPAADVFALGAVLYECLAGWPAFGGRSIFEVIEKIANEEPSPIANVRPDTPAWLAGVVARALARDPRARYASGGEMLGALRARKAGAAPARSFAKLAAVASAVALVLGVAAVAAFGPPRQGDGESGAGPRAPSSRLAQRVSAARLKLEGSASVASADAPAADLLVPEATGLVDLAARRLLVYSVEDVGTLGSACPGKPAAAVLRAVRALSAPEERAAAEEVLRKAPPPFLAANELARLAQRVDALSQGVLLGVETGDENPVGALQASLAGLGKTASSDALDAAFAPLEQALLRTMSGCALGVSDVNEYAFAKLLQRPPLPDMLPRRTRAALDAYLLFAKRQPSATQFDDAWTRRIEALGIETGERAPEVAACLLASALEYRRTWSTHGTPVEAGALERDDAALGAVAGALGAHPSSAIGLLLARSERAIASMRLDAGIGDARENVRRGLDAARRASVLAKESYAGDVGRADVSDPLWLLRFLLEAEKGQDPDFEAALAAGSSASPVLAVEATRLRRGPKDALAEADSLSRSELMDNSIEAVRALALAELGRFAEARRAVDEVEKGAPSSYLPLARFRPAALRAAIAAREKKK